MSVNAITTIESAHGVRVVPDPASYTRVSDDWTEEEFRVFEFDNGSLGGLWQGQPGQVYFDHWPYTEVCVIVKGHIAIEDESGARRDFHAGMAFVVPEGFRGTWITVSPTVKYFVGVPGASTTATQASASG